MNLLHEILSRCDRGNCPSSKWPDSNGDYWPLNPLRTDRKSGSFSIGLKGYVDFASGENGGLLDLALKLELDPGNGNGSGEHWDAIHVYRNADGSELLKVKRRGCGENKIIRRDPAGIKGPYPLYRLPELLTAPKLPVVIVEGEKAVDALVSVLKDTHCVVTWLGGTNSVKNTDFSPLKDRAVTFWPDNDLPGRKAMSTIKAKLGAGTILNPPADVPLKWDAADAVTERGATWCKEFIAAISENSDVPTWEPQMLSAFEISSKDYEPRIWFSLGITTGLNIIAAAKAAGKTLLAYQLCNAVSQGIDFLGKPTTKTNVMYVSFELQEDSFHERIKPLGPAPSNLVFEFNWQTEGYAAIADTEYFAKKYDIGLFVFDTFLYVVPEDFRDLNDYYNSKLYRAWRIMAARNKIAILGHWHSPKAKYMDFFSNAINSVGLTAQADSFLYLERARMKTESLLYLGGNHGPERKICLTQKEKLQFELAVGEDGESENAWRRPTPEEKRILEIMEKYFPDGAKLDTIAVRLGKISKSEKEVVRAHLKNLKEKGFADNKIKGFWTLNCEEELFSRDRNGTED